MSGNGTWTVLALAAVAVGPFTLVVASGGAGDVYVWAGAALMFLVTGWLFLRSLPR